MATSFSLEVPQSASGTAPVSRVVLRLSLESDAALSLQITDPRAVAHTFTPAVPAPSNPAPTPGSASFDYPLFGGQSDFVLVQREGGTSATDPVRQTCVVTMTLNTIVAPGSCNSNTPGAAVTWQFLVTAGPEISGVCHISLTPDIGAGCFGAVNMPATTPLAQLARVDGRADQLCGLQRAGRPAQVELVLDRSGSMSANSNLTGFPLATTRMLALHTAVQNFVSTWDSLDVAGDQVGVVTFDHLPPEQPFGVGLQGFAAVGGAISAGISAVTPRGATSIGAGLLKGLESFDANHDGVPDSTDRKVVLLMSDGQQNTDPLVGVDLPSKRVFTFNAASPGVQANLPLLGNYQIYNMTIGPDIAVEPAIKYHMANVTGGYYINTETDGNLLKPFFLDLLGSFVHFNSWQTSRLIHSRVTLKDNYETELYLATTTQMVVVSLSWDVRLGSLKLLLEAPDGSQPGDVRYDFERGIAVWSFDPTGMLYREKPWRLYVALADLSGIGKETGGAIPFDLVVLVEDVAISSSLGALPQDYKPGDMIELEVQLREFGLPMEKIGANPGDQVLVQVVRPGASVGDILSDGKAGSRPPSGDLSGAAQGKLASMLADDPAAFRRNDDNPDIVTLSEAEPGVYRGSFPAPVAGHYNFLFGVAGLAPETGRFSRQAIRTVYVRAVPDAQNTQAQASVSGAVLTISLTPRTRGESRMGPGWASYFWFTAPGFKPFRARDNLDGSYTATLSFSGTEPPPVTLHFIDVLQSLGEEIDPQRLPVELGKGTVLIDQIPGTGNPRLNADDESLRGCLVLLVRLLIAIGRLSIRFLERVLKMLSE